MAEENDLNLYILWYMLYYFNVICINSFYVSCKNEIFRIFADVVKTFVLFHFL